MGFSVFFPPNKFILSTRVDFLSFITSLTPFHTLSVHFQICKNIFSPDNKISIHPVCVCLVEPSNIKPLFY